MLNKVFIIIDDRGKPLAGKLDERDAVRYLASLADVPYGEVENLDADAIKEVTGYSLVAIYVD